MTADSELVMSETEQAAGGFDPENKYPCYDGDGKHYKKGDGGEYSNIRHHRFMAKVKEERGQSVRKGKWKRQREDSEFREEGIGDEDEESMVKSK
jgi:hypothetical protein